MALTAEEIQRYKRHLVLKEVGGQGQSRLKAARVLVVGAGGLGSPSPHVSGRRRCRHARHHRRRHRVARQPAAPDRARHGATSARLKVESAREAVARSIPRRASRRIDQRLDGRQRPRHHRPLRHRHRWLGQLRHTLSRLATPATSPASRWCSRPSGPSTATSHAEAAPARRRRQALSHLPLPVPRGPPPGTVANCAEVGVLGSVVGVIGTLAATEILKEITGAGESLAGRLLLYDAKAARFETLIRLLGSGQSLVGRPRRRSAISSCPCRLCRNWYAEASDGPLASAPFLPLSFGLVTCADTTLGIIKRA